jgi:pimeloyl-ACP methyl ester carboxylesterase
MNGAMFASQLNFFRDRYRCIAWDQRAHGGSFTDPGFTAWDSAALPCSPPIVCERWRCLDHPPARKRKRRKRSTGR